jgi:hypothetical protein
MYSIKKVDDLVGGPWALVREDFAGESQVVAVFADLAFAGQVRDILNASATVELKLMN